MNEEALRRVASRMEDAAERMERAACTASEVAQRIAWMLEDGYGGNGVRLIQLLDNAEQHLTKE